MKKRVLGLVLALCLIVGLLPVTALAADAEAKVRFNNYSNTESSEKSIYFTLKNGETKYATTNDKKDFVAWTGTEAPTDKYVKGEYKDGVLTVTFKNIDIYDENTSTNNMSSYPVYFYEGEYAAKVVLEGENKIETAKACAIVSKAKQGLTVTGAGSLTINIPGGPSGAIQNWTGNLLIKDTNLDITVGTTSWRHSILCVTGSAVIEGSKIKSTSGGGSLIFFGKVTSSDANGMTNTDTDTSRTLTIKDCEIEAVSEGGASIFHTAAPAVVDNCTITASMTNAKKVFRVAPEFKNCTAVAGLKATNTKAYDPAKNAQYTYMKVTPGTGAGTGTESGTTGGTTTGGTTTGGTTTGGTTTGGTTTTNPSTGDNFNIVLVSALALTSAATVAGVSVMNKRKYNA